MKDENLTYIEMYQRLLFFNMINKNQRIYSEDSFVAITGDCSAVGGSLRLYLELATQEIMKDIMNPKRYFDIRKVIWENMSDRQYLYNVLKNNPHIEKNGNIDTRGIELIRIVE